MINTTWQAKDWFVYTELAKRMDERLLLIKKQPEHVFIVGADFNESAALLVQRYPQVQLSVFDPRAEFLAYSQTNQQKQRSIWQKLTKKNTVHTQQPVNAPLPVASADFVWSNLALYTEADPVTVFPQWSDALKKDGLLFFSALGPDTLQEIVAYLAKHNVTLTAQRLWDMHDLGDMMFYNGFNEPVMDMEKMNLTYQSAESFWRDYHIINAKTLFDQDISADPSIKSLIDQGFSTGELNQITLEVIYGHGLKKITLPDQQSVVNFYPKRPEA
ncbi:MAG: methyltransferase domain-containing protein [Neisseriaceae bacterium]|nr:methyltransferase domain-containing protein [Neisseriaceae bacterium]MBP6863139.1 methyltransferase domain-containing protein [Neisseriaceae bacterium]